MYVIRREVGGLEHPTPFPATWHKFDTPWPWTHQNQQYPAHQWRWKNFQMGSTDWPGRQYDQTVWCKALCLMHLLQHWPVLASVAPCERTTEDKLLVNFNQSHQNVLIEVFNATVTEGLTWLVYNCCGNINRSGKIKDVLDTVMSRNSVIITSSIAGTICWVFKWFISLLF